MPAAMTALMIAAFGGYPDPVRALLEHRADPNAKNNQGRTVLMAAVTGARRRRRRRRCSTRAPMSAPPMPAAWSR